MLLFKVTYVIIVLAFPSADRGCYRGIGIWLLAPVRRDDTQIKVLNYLQSTFLELIIRLNHVVIVRAYDIFAISLSDSVIVTMKVTSYVIICLGGLLTVDPPGLCVAATQDTVAILIVSRGVLIKSVVLYACR